MLATVVVFGEALTDDMLSTAVHGVTRLGSEAAVECNQLGGNILPTEPPHAVASGTAKSLDNFSVDARRL
jgi:hypothetical protein